MVKKPQQVIEESIEEDTDKKPALSRFDSFINGQEAEKKKKQAKPQQALGSKKKSTGFPSSKSKPVKASVPL